MFYWFTLSTAEILVQGTIISCLNCCNSFHPRPSLKSILTKATRVILLKQQHIISLICSKPSYSFMMWSFLLFVLFIPMLLGSREPSTSPFFLTCCSLRTRVLSVPFVVHQDSCMIDSIFFGSLPNEPNPDYFISYHQSLPLPQSILPNPFCSFFSIAFLIF